MSATSLLVACSLPAASRLWKNGLTEPVGLFSDLGVAVLFYTLARCCPPWLRAPLVLIWAFFQAAAIELFSALQRLPSWYDLHYLTDPDFVSASVDGFRFSSPWLVGLLMASALLVAVKPVHRWGYRPLVLGLVVAFSLLLGQGMASNWYDEQPVAARYNGLHWFVEDALSEVLGQEVGPMTEEELPAGLRQFDLAGTPLLAGQGQAKNVLIIVLEGISGLYHPEMRQAMGVRTDELTMDSLAASTADGMLIPDFAVASHQTIRGLYSMLCGDYSKLSYQTPKAFELLQNTFRAKECLPAQMAARGWSTHFLQASGLQFMAKDKVMETIGFQKVLGSEWFTEANPFPFEWGVIDDVFFKGARHYINNLRKKRAPWMLTLLTVGTHQPYGVTDEAAERYTTRKIASVAELDRVVGRFIDRLRRDGVLKDTLVIITSDESHGSDLADWISSWGLGIVLAPEKQQLPRIKAGGYGLVDLTASVLDYLGLAVPPSVIGRSFFRDYDQPRDMLSFTASKLRCLTGGKRYECTDNGNCRVGKAASILGDPPQDFHRDSKEDNRRIFAIARTLDNKLLTQPSTKVLRFAKGEVRRLPEKIGSEWAENLVGAQYLDFPAQSTVHVSVRVKAVKAPSSGINLNLLIKEWDMDSHDIPFDNFPILHAGEEGKVEFSFYNPRARQSFSFFLVGEGKNGMVKLEDFTVTIDQNRS
ncbi:MAG: LTA synthase family protein [Proteobacteria bacterium]|nr:LTA synthase family protein [Pseudomonadota bacterium]